MFEDKDHDQGVPEKANRWIFITLAAAQPSVSADGHSQVYSSVLLQTRPED